MQKDFQNIRRLTLAATKNDGVYYYFARRLHINENTLTLLYALGDGQAPARLHILLHAIPALLLQGSSLDLDIISYFAQKRKAQLVFFYKSSPFFQIAETDFGKFTSAGRM